MYGNGRQDIELRGAPVAPAALAEWYDRQTTDGRGAPLPFLSASRLSFAIEVAAYIIVILTAVAVLALIGLAAVLLAPTLLIAILSLGVQGLAMALLYLLFGAPDLSFTQFMVETLSVVMFALVMVRLKLGPPQRRTVTAAVRDGGVALLGGGGVALLLLKILEKPLDDRLGTFFADNAARLAHGHNIVNVILVDFRGLDTLGEISVVMAAGIAILLLITGGRLTRSRPETPLPPAPAEHGAP